MEDTLGGVYILNKIKQSTVLILVLMEDTLGGYSYKSMRRYRKS